MAGRPWPSEPDRDGRMPRDGAVAAGGRLAAARLGLQLNLAAAGPRQASHRHRQSGSSLSSGRTQTRANCPGDPSVSALNWDAERHCPQSATGRLQASNAQTQRIALFKKNSTLRFAFKPINKPLPYKIRKGKLLTFGDRERAARKPEHGRTQLASQDTSSSQRARKLPADRAAAATR